MSDDNSPRVPKCLYCSNTTFSEDSEHCRECGAPLENWCSNDGCEVSALPWHFKHCEKCGSRTRLDVWLEEAKTAALEAF